jgi:hypothetical protein
LIHISLRFHSLNFGSPNVKCEPIFNIHTSRPLHQYTKNLIQIRFIICKNVPKIMSNFQNEYSFGNVGTHFFALFELNIIIIIIIRKKNFHVLTFVARPKLMFQHHVSFWDESNIKHVITVDYKTHYIHP